MINPTLNLIVLRAADIERTKAFYVCFGFDFQLEQHGKGAQHYASSINGLVFEIYPALEATINDKKAIGAISLGFKVDETIGMDTLLNSLIANGGIVISAPKASAWGLRAVVQDPDGRNIVLTT